jgi:hypothetical protein
MSPSAKPKIKLTFVPARSTVRAALHRNLERERGASLRDVRSILDAHYLHRDPALAESAIQKLERRTAAPK